MTTSKLTITFASLAAGLLIVMLAVSITHSVTQQYFESVLPVAQYTANLIQYDGALRIIIGLDNLFILSYFLATYFFSLLLAKENERHQLLKLFAFLVGAIALLDYQENLHILAMLKASLQSIQLTSGQIELQYVLSAVKWHLAYVAFFILGLSLRAQSPMEKLFVFSLLFLQMPIGILVYTIGDHEWERVFMVFRYACLLAGFVFIAIITARRQQR